MAYQHTETHHISYLAQRAWGVVGTAVSGIYRIFVTASDTNRRMQIVAQLSEKSDEELAILGLRREDIVRRVFNDMKEI